MTFLRSKWQYGVCVIYRKGFYEMKICYHCAHPLQSVRNKDAYTVEECLDRGLDPEQVTGWYCDHCEPSEVVKKATGIECWDDLYRNGKA